jgi:hypothetical protein
MLPVPHPTHGGLPQIVRISPNRTALRVAFGAGLVLSSILLFRGAPVRHPDDPVLATLYWICLGAALLTMVGCGWRLLVQLPIIEASELGIAIWFGGPYRRPFFAPWGRVRAIVLTQVRPRNGVAAPRSTLPALGIELDCDDRFRLPQEAAHTDIPIGGAARADLAWSGRSIGGDVRRWVELLERMRSIYGESAQT